MHLNIFLSFIARRAVIPHIHFNANVNVDHQLGHINSSSELHERKYLSISANPQVGKYTLTQ
jgi:hypothetical protein